MGDFDFDKFFNETLGDDFFKAFGTGTKEKPVDQTTTEKAPFEKMMDRIAEMLAKRVEEHKYDQMKMLEVQFHMFQSVLERTDKLMARQDQTVDQLLGIIAKLTDKKAPEGK